MKMIRFGAGVLCVALSLVAGVAVAQFTTPSVPGVTTSTPTIHGAIKDSAMTGTDGSASMSATNPTDGHLDAAVAALDRGDKAASTEELKTGIAGLETDAKQSKTSFKDKLLSQVGKLKALLPLIMGGGLSSGILGKAVGLAKLASGGNQLAGLLDAGSLIGKGSQLTSSLNGLSGAMSVLGGGASTGQSLISTALGSVSKLDQGGMVAKAAEPVVKNQLGSVLNFVKGAL